MDLEDLRNGGILHGLRPHTEDAHAFGARLAKLGVDLIKEWG
jgi:hypothetical protein